MRTLQRVLRAMADADGSLSEEDAASLLFMSTRNFRRRFTNLTGMSFRKKSLEIKLNRAQMLMDTTDWSIPMIAERLGYSERSKLDKAFKRAFSVTPIQYVQNQRSRRLAR